MRFCIAFCHDTGWSIGVVDTEFVGLVKMSNFTFNECVGMFPVKEGWIQVLAGLAPSGKTVEPLLITPGWQSWLEKIGQMPVRQIFFNGKIHSTTFD